MTALATNISFGKVRGKFGSPILSAGDADGLPDFQALTGLEVTFTPKPDIILNLGASPDPVTFLTEKIVCTLDDNGYLVGPDGREGVMLIATDDTDLAPTGWTYSVSFGGTQATYKRLTGFEISVPAGSSRWLTAIAPIPAASGSSTLTEVQAAIVQVGVAVGNAQSYANAAATSASQAAASVSTFSVDNLPQATSVGKALMKGSAASGRSALSAVGVGDLVVSVADFSPAGDGVTDDTAAVQAAANAAAAAGRKLYIPGRYLITSLVSVSTPVICDGAIVVNTANSGARLKFVRTATSVTLTAASLGGLTAGSRNITGLGGQRGTLVLTSTDHLLERNNGVGQFYTFAETQTVVNSAGDIIPALDNAFSTSTLTAILYPEDAPLTVDRLNVEVVGTATPTADHYVGVYRSNVTLNALRVYNTTTTSPINAVRVQDAANVVFNQPRIHGFDEGGTGYGIAAYGCCNIRVNDGNVTKCRHTVSGRSNKTLILDGGTYDGGIDTHWGTDTKLLNLTSNVPTGFPHLAVAGKGVTIKNCVLNGGRAIVGIRNDSPELSGEVVVEDVTWTTSDTQVWVVGHSSAVQAFFDYGRPMKKPERTSIRRVSIQGSGAPVVSGVFGVSHAYPQTYWGDIDIDRVRVTVGGVSYFWIGVLLDKDSANHADSVGSRIRLANLDFTTSNNDNVVIQNTGDVSDSKGFELTVENCTNVHLQLPENGMKSVVLRDSLVTRLRPIATSAQPFQGSYLFDGCTLNACAFSGQFLADFVNNTFAGATTSTVVTLDNRVKSYRGNLHAVGATGYPTRAEGYKNATYYI